MVLLQEVQRENKNTNIEYKFITAIRDCDLECAEELLWNFFLTV